MMKFLAVFILLALAHQIAAAASSKDRSQSKTDAKSAAHKQIDYIDPQNTEHWVTQANVEADVYNTGSYLYSSITSSSHNWSVQLGGQNIPLTPGDPTVPFIYGGLTRQFDFNDWLNLTLGSQIGSYSNSFTFLNFDYATLGLNYHQLSLAVGPYYANQELTETVSTIGYIVFWNYNYDDFTINGNYISGANNINGLSANIGYNINRYLQPYVGFGDVAPNLSCNQCAQYYYMAFGINLNI
jgi:hypothetical protein